MGATPMRTPRSLAQEKTGVDGNPTSHDAACVQARRLEEHSERIDILEDRMHDGSVEFARVGVRLDNLTDKVASLVSVLTWVGGAIGLGLLGAAGTALVWTLAHMGGAK